MALPRDIDPAALDRTLAEIGIKPAPARRRLTRSWRILIVVAVLAIPNLIGMIIVRSGYAPQLAEQLAQLLEAQIEGHPTQPASPQVVEVTAGVANIRERPSAQGTIIGKRVRRDQLTTTGPAEGEWLPVMEQGRKAYIHESVVRQAPPQMPGFLSFGAGIPFFNYILLASIGMMPICAMVAFIWGRNAALKTYVWVVFLPIALIVGVVAGLFGPRYRRYYYY